MSRANSPETRTHRTASQAFPHVPLLCYSQFRKESIEIVSVDENWDVEGLGEQLE